MALGAAEGVGSAAFGVVEGVVVVAHQGSGQERPQDHPGEDEIDREDRCDELQPKFRRDRTAQERRRRARIP